jgi:hypothetical protein
MTARAAAGLDEFLTRVGDRDHRIRGSRFQWDRAARGGHAGVGALRPHQQVIRRGSYSSVKGLIAAIGRFIVWTKTADDLLDQCRPGKRTPSTRH